MAKRSLMLTSTEAGTGKKMQKAISDINPAATADTMKNFTLKLNALTTNTYVQTDCIDRFNVDTEAPTGTYAQDATLRVIQEDDANSRVFYEPGASLAIKRQGWDYINFWVYYDGDGNLSAEVVSGCTNISVSVSTPFPRSGNPKARALTVRGRTDGDNENLVGGTIKIKSSATENYKAAEVTYVIDPSK